MTYRRNQTVVLLFLAGIVSIFFWSAQSAIAQSGQQTTAIVETHPSQGDVVEITGTSASLTTTSEGASVVLSTVQLEPGNVHTLWWVIVNRPEACATVPCTAKDILGATEAVAAEATYAAGQIIDDTGSATFSASLSVGDVPNPWFGNGFTNPLGAEIHMVINDHGPAIPEMVDNMLNTYRGGCTDDSLPGAFPVTATSNGDPGPNTCRLVQDAIFQQLPTGLPATGGSPANLAPVWLQFLTVGSIIVAAGWLIRRKAHGHRLLR